MLLADETITTHGFVFTTLHAQPSNVVTASEFVSAPAPCAALFVESVKVQAAPDCVTVKFWFAMLTTPVRLSAVGFASTL